MPSINLKSSIAQVGVKQHQGYLSGLRRPRRNDGVAPTAVLVVAHEKAVAINTIWTGVHVVCVLSCRTRHLATRSLQPVMMTICTDAHVVYVSRVLIVFADGSPGAVPP